MDIVVVVVSVLISSVFVFVVVVVVVLAVLVVTTAVVLITIAHFIDRIFCRPSRGHAVIIFSGFCCIKTLFSLSVV